MIGAGAIGGTVAALLHRAGHPVEVTARGTHLEAIVASGIQLTGAWGDYRATVDAGPVLSRRPELVIVATKAMAAPAAVIANQKMLGEAPVVVFQNGLDGLEAVASASPHTPLVGALSLIAASLVAPGEVTVTTAASTWLGMANPGDPDDPARYAESILSQAIPCEVVTNFLGARWTKLIINQANALPAITGLSMQNVIEHPKLRALMAQSMQEAARIGLARGVHFEEVNGITHTDIARLAAAPAADADFIALRLRDYLGDVPNPGSTLQSIRRGQASEIDYLNGAVVAAGQSVGLPVDTNARLVKLVHEVEQSGRFFDPDTVLSRF